MPEADIRALRRQTAFYCHPDRGGNERVMARLNALFDFLDTAGNEYVQETSS